MSDLIIELPPELDWITIQEAGFRKNDVLFRGSFTNSKKKNNFAAKNKA